MNAALASLLGAAAGYFTARLLDHLLGLDRAAERLARSILEVAPWLRLDGAADVTREVSI